jgi:two-component system, OmpR family, KDP operon response regulator KdpE
VSLTPIEYNLLRELIINAGKTLTYRYLLNKIWGLEYGTEREYLYVYVGYLRAKLEADPKHAKHVLTVPGIGYKFNKAE